MKRRNFLKIFGLSAGAAAVGTSVIPSVTSAPPPIPPGQGLLAQIEAVETYEYHMLCGAEFKKEMEAVLNSIDDSQTI